MTLKVAKAKFHFHSVSVTFALNLAFFESCFCNRKCIYIISYGIVEVMSLQLLSLFGIRKCCDSISMLLWLELELLCGFIFNIVKYQNIIDIGTCEHDICKLYNWGEGNSEYDCEVYTRTIVLYFLGTRRLFNFYTENHTQPALFFI